MANEIMILGELGELAEIKAEDLYLKDGMAKVINLIRKKATEIYIDTTTKKGLEEVRSLAYSITRCRTHLSKLGKEITEDWREKTKNVNSIRSKMEEELQALEEQIRKPLTDAENKEKEKQELIKKIADLKVFLNISNGVDIKEIETRIETLKTLQLDENCPELVKAKNESNIFLEEMLENAKKQAEEKAELLRLRKIAEEAERKEKEEKIKKEAEAKAQEDAQKQIEQNKIKAQEALAKAEKEKEEAVLAERKRLEEEQKKIAEENAKREADLEHVKTVNNKAKNDLIKIGFSEEQAKLIISSISRGMITNVKIVY